MKPDTVDIQRVERVYIALRRRLERERADSGLWIGRLSPSALSTATSISALRLHHPQRHADRIARGLHWLARTRNADGGWGDSARSGSNVSTTALVLAALTLADGPRELRKDAERYVDGHGGLQGIIGRYGEDRTFSAPILTNLALARLADWRECPQLPFWLAALPRRLFPLLGLRVVSYALPALIAVGLARFNRLPGPSGPGRSFRAATIPRVLRLLERVTPRSGGYLEATPITGFVAMSLIAAGYRSHPVVERNIGFLCDLQAEDGSWRIERDLAVWLTTLSVNALGRGEATTREALLSAQMTTRHPYVGSAPGGWGWTCTDGSVPDADDTSGALLALRHLPDCKGSRRAAGAGTRWLLGLQNRDGGWPTFCRGWMKLPFDQSCADITAHAIRALLAWPDAAGRKQADAAVSRATSFLAHAQRPDGSWIPLWFGNEHAPENANPVYGTSRVLLALRDMHRLDEPMARHAIDYLLDAQNEDGTWGGACGVRGSIEETALACEALAACRLDPARAAVNKGVRHLCDLAERTEDLEPAPIGLYFAKLWYFEHLYPLIFMVAALRQVLRA